MGLLLFQFGPHYESSLSFALTCDDEIEDEVVQAIAAHREQVACYDIARKAIEQEIRADYRGIVEAWEEANPAPIKPKGPANGSREEFLAYEPARTAWARAYDQWLEDSKAVQKQWEDAIRPLIEARVVSELQAPASRGEMLKSNFGDRARLVSYRTVHGESTASLQYAIESETRCGDGYLTDVGYTYGLGEAIL